MAVGVSVSDNLIGWTMDETISETITSTDTNVRTLTTGDIIKVVDGAYRGRYFEYVGEGVSYASDEDPIDFSIEDFGDSQSWKAVGFSRSGRPSADLRGYFDN